MEFPAWLQPYQPLLPLPSLIEEINNIYHSFDADNYDRDHLEVRLLWPHLWAEMMDQLPVQHRWRVLDFGCGTGFEAEQFLERFSSSVELLIAYDPSAAMLARCRSRFAGKNNVTCVQEISGIKSHGPYNILLTNSVLHHLPDIKSTISELSESLSDRAFWLAGNEPSGRFYRNETCYRLFSDYSRYLARKKWLEPHAYIDKFRRLIGQHTLSRTAHAAFNKHLFASLPSVTVIARLVDFHVPHPLDNNQGDRGIELESISRYLQQEWDLVWSKTYSYLGPFSELRAPQRWRFQAQKLQEKFPHDGANFCAVWSRHS